MDGLKKEHAQPGMKSHVHSPAPANMRGEQLNVVSDIQPYNLTITMTAEHQDYRAGQGDEQGCS